MDTSKCATLLTAALLNYMPALSLAAETSPVCFRIQMEASNTYKRIISTDKRSLTISQQHADGTLNVKEALSGARDLVERQRVQYAHLANTLSSASLLGCPVSAANLDPLESE